MESPTRKAKSIEICGKVSCESNSKCFSRCGAASRSGVRIRTLGRSSAFATLLRSTKLIDSDSTTMGSCGFVSESGRSCCALSSSVSVIGGCAGSPQWNLQFGQLEQHHRVIKWLSTSSSHSCIFRIAKRG